jgi:AcrR family transcriptional regulator
LVSSSRIFGVTRWEPNARGRLQEAALELFSERGFEQTTVEHIAKRAGLTKRTFFRHFSDKREALFGGGEEFEALFADGLAGVPASATPMEAIAATLEAVAAGFRPTRDFARRRQTVITANAGLQERELVKLAAVAASLAGGLRERGVTEPAATLTADTAIAVFRNAFERWVAAADQRDLPELIRESLDALRTLTAG